MKSTLESFAHDSTMHDKFTLCKFYTKIGGRVALTDFSLSIGAIDVYNIGRYTVKLSMLGYSRDYRISVEFDGILYPEFTQYALTYKRAQEIMSTRISMFQ